MPRDYARYVNQPKRPIAQHGWRRRLLWVVVTLFLLGGLAYGFVVYKHYQETAESPSMALWVKQLKSFFSKKPEANEAPSVDGKDVVEEGHDTDIQFSFYTELPTMQVSAPPSPPTEIVIEKHQPADAVGEKHQPTEVASLTKTVEKPVETPPPAPQRTIEDGRYLLQLAAFKNPSAAGEMRISLLLAGFEVEIVKAIHDNQQIYQLQQGPFSTLPQARAMQQQLKNKGIESVIVKKIA